MRDTAQMLDSPAELYECGCRLLELRETEKARQTFQRILEQDDGCYQAVNKLGVLLAEEKKPDEAMRRFEQCLALMPDYAPALVNMGNLAKEGGDPETAIGFYLRAIAADESYPFSYYNLAVAYKSMRKLDLYLAALKKYRRYYRTHTVRKDEPETLRNRYGKQLLIALAVVLLIVAARFSTH